MRKLSLMLSAMFLLLLNTMAQTRTVTGKVTDENGAPIPNVSVLVRGTTTGTTTATDGTYSITVPANAKELLFSSLSYDATSINIGNKTVISVTMAAAGSKDLGEVVVTGISRVKKSQYTGAATKIDEKALKNQPVGSFDQILQGRAPGLISLTGSGAPGTSSNVIIRGSGSISGGTGPLYIIDGIPVEAGVFQGLNPNDFASIDVIRDAAGAALYGSRGSSGVIVVTTKKGTAGRIKLSYSGQMGVKSKPEFAFRPMNTTELLRAQEDYGKIVGITASSPTLPGWYYSTSNPRYATLSPAQQVSEKSIYDSIAGINTNWSDQVFRNGNFSNHQISLSGGTGKTLFYSSLGLYNEEGTALRSDMSRVTLRNNISFADDKFSYGINLSLGYTKRNNPQTSVGNNLGNPFLTSAVNVPYARLTNSNGTYATGIGASYAAANQLDITKYDENYNDQFKGNLSINADYKITKDLTAAIVTGIDFRETQSTNYGSKLAFIRLSSTSITGKAGFQTEGLTRYLSADIRPSLTYRKVVNQKHDIEVAAYGEYIKQINKGFSSTGFGTDPKRPNSIAAITQGNAANQLYAQITGFKTENLLLSGLATARYTYNGKYTVSGSYRKDGASKLTTDTRWQDFYSIGAVWEASKESFIKNIRQINSLRLKVNYGINGNFDNFPGGDYPYQAQYSGGNYSGLNTIFALTPGYTSLKWETTKTTNLGLDFEILNRRVYGDVNVYNKETVDLFVTRNLSATSGFGFYPLDVNAGKLSNKGVEVALTGELIRKKDFLWSVNGNFGYNKNRVKDLGGLNSYEQGTELVAVGMPLGSHYEVKWAGVDAATGQPLYFDINGNIVNVRSDADRVQEFGTWEAPWKGGFGTNLRFKGFDVNVLFSWQRGGTKVDNMEYFTENPVGFLANGYNQSSDLNFWKKPGDIVNTPSPLYGTDFSSKIIHDASFVRLRDVTLSYTVPTSYLGKVKYLSNVRFYVQGSNLFIWTKWRGRDPEAGATNINLSEYPNPRTFTGGLEITF